MLGGLALGLMARPVLAQSVPLVGVYTAMGRQSQATQEDAFLQGMRDAGYIEGQNVRYAFRYGAGVTAELLPLALELAALRPDVIVSSQAIGAVPGVQEAFAPFPVVCAAITPNLSLITNLDRPEGNITGILTPGVGDRDRLALAVELTSATRVGILVAAAGTAVTEAYHQSLRQVGVDLGIDLRLGIAQSTDDAVAAFDGLVSAGVEVVSYPTSSPQFNARRADIIERARQAAMPTVYDRRDAVWEGGLIGIGPDQRAGWRRAAHYVDRLLKGSAIADLPVEINDRVDLAINLTTAAELGLVFPPSILVRATEVIQ